MQFANIAYQVGVLFERLARVQQTSVVSAVDVQHDHNCGAAGFFIKLFFGSINIIRHFSGFRILVRAALP